MMSLVIPEMNHKDTLVEKYSTKKDIPQNIDNSCFNYFIMQDK